MTAFSFAILCVCVRLPKILLAVNVFALYHNTWILIFGPLSNVLCVFICEFTISKIAFSASALPHTLLFEGECKEICSSVNYSSVAISESAEVYL